MHFEKRTQEEAINEKLTLTRQIPDPEVCWNNQKLRRHDAQHVKKYLMKILLPPN
jgi:hypothetical protein